jgi:hypothetical protein
VCVCVCGERGEDGLAVTAMIGVSGNGGEDGALTDVSSHCCTKVSKLQSDASCKRLDQIWGREGERGFVVASEGGWVCACILSRAVYCCCYLCLYMPCLHMRVYVCVGVRRVGLRRKTKLLGYRMCVCDSVCVCVCVCVWCVCAAPPLVVRLAEWVPPVGGALSSE